LKVRLREFTSVPESDGTEILRSAQDDNQLLVVRSQRRPELADSKGVFDLRIRNVLVGQLSNLA
jgi:hypothetical protein